MKFTNNKNYLYLFALSFKYNFFNRFLSYFAKPYFIVFEEWFDNDFKKTKLINNKKMTTISKIH